MSKHLYLPALKEKANVREPEQDGIWSAQDKNWLSALAAGIKAKPSKVSSIPDVYARPLLFWGAFEQLTHPLHPDIVQEWRGLLSLLALDTVKKVGLNYQTVAFGDDALSKAILGLPPEAVALEKGAEPYRWTELILIQHEGITLGALSPATLVFTAADYELKLKGKHFPYKDQETGLLRPPRKAENQGEELESVGEWVKWLKSAFDDQTNKTDPAAATLVNAINRELDAWLVDIRTELGPTDLNAPDHKPGDRPSRIPEPELLDRYGIYKRLLTPLVNDPDATRGRVSDYELAVADPGRLPAGVKHVVVVHNDLSRNLLLWRPIKFTDLGSAPLATLFPGASGQQLNGQDIGKDGGLWIRPELYFLTSTLTRAKAGGAVLPDGEKDSNGKNSHYLLPLKPEILHFFTVAEITKTLVPHYEEDGDRVLFKISLPMKSGPPLEITKTYLTKGNAPQAGEGMVVEREMPVLELFPNYMGEFWARYYLLFSDTNALTATPVSRATKLYLESRERQLSREDGGLQAILTRISGADCFPEGIALTMRGDGAAVGLVLVEKDPKMVNANFKNKAIVGVDFGTSNTNVFIQVGDETHGMKPLELKFGSRYLRPLLAAAPTDRDQYSRAFLVPASDEDGKMPTPTALRKFNLVAQRELMLDDFPYFPNQPRYPSNVEVDIKWESEDTTNLNNYLEGLVFLLLLEVVKLNVGHVEFRCTYPKAFSANQTDNYQAIWITTLERLFVTRHDTEAQLEEGRKLLYTAGGVAIESIVTIHRANGNFEVACHPYFETEGTAAGEYFSNRAMVNDLANRKDGAICIDVGGGTTDFSIWSQGTISLNASVRLAGREITEAMQDNQRISSNLFSPEASAALREVSGNRFNSRMNFVLKKEHASIPARLTERVNNRDLVHLRRLLVVEFGALAFYAGHLVLALDQFKAGTLGQSIAKAGISLHWGGNASKMLSWIDQGTFKPDGTATKFLNGLFASVLMGEVAPVANRIRIPGGLLAQKQSPGHKNEAAGGTVVGPGKHRYGVAPVADDDYGVPGMTAVAESLDNKVIMAESIVLDSSPTPTVAYEPLSEDAFKEKTNLSPFQSTTLVQFDYFLKVLNFNGQRTGFMKPGEEITLSLQERQGIINNVQTEFDKLAGKEPSRRAVEPAFIMEVRELLKIMVGKMRN